LFDGIGTHLLQVIDHLGNRVCKELSFAGADPFEPDPIICKAHLVEDALQDGYPSPSFVISRLIMAVSGMTPSDQHAICSVDEGFEDIDRIHRSRTHQMNDADIGRILLPRGAGQICSRIGAPVAEKSDNPRFKLSHVYPP
jgi:hypothetical protein